MGSEAVFLVLVWVTLAGAIGVVTTRNPLYAALSLLAAFLGVAGIFAFQEALFLAAVQVLVYAGAILVLFLFVIMLLSLRETEFGSEVKPRRKAWALVASTLVASGLAIPAFFLPAEGATVVGAQLGVVELSESLFREHLFAFELVSVLIVAAIVGAVVLAKRKV